MTSPEFDWKTLMTGDFSDGSGTSSQDHTPLGRPFGVPASSHQGRLSASTSTLAQQQHQHQHQQQTLPRMPRPASSSSFLSIASSPGPIRQHSSPIPPSRTMSKRPKSRRAEMDVKVLYTLDSHPNSTLIATLGRRTAVQVVHLGKKGNKRKLQVFGKVSLKTCLNAICMASPELMIDRKQDYVLYAVDPIESYRVRQRTESASIASTSTTKQVDFENKEGKNKTASAFVVGKGFFTWALAESGDGQSLVHGRIRDEYAEEDDSDGSDEEDDDDSYSGKILEVSLRLKAASSTSRDQFIDRVKVFQASTPLAPSVAVESPPEDNQDRPHEDANDMKKSHQLHSASSPVTATEREQSKIATAMTSTPAQQQLLRFLQALQAQAAAPSPLQDVAANSQQSTSQVIQTNKQSWQQSVVANTNNPAKTANANSPDAMVHLMRSLKGVSPSGSTVAERPMQSNKSTALPAKAAAVHTFSAPRSSTVGFTKSPLPDSAPSPILGGLTPGYEAGYISRTSPNTDTKASVPQIKVDKANMDIKEMSKEASSYYNASNEAVSLETDRLKQCCYNCGATSQRSWRHLDLIDEEEVRYKEGSIVFDHGRKVYRSCNACGLYFNKYAGISRPEHVWKEAQRVKSEKFHPAKCNCSIGEGSAEDGEGIVHGTLLRHKQLARTLSEACEQDACRRLSVGAGEDESDQEMTGGSLPARRMTNWDEARLKDLVQDSKGEWRTKRSIMENPSNKRPGRPKGSKTGAGRGRPREDKSRRLKRNKCQDAATEGGVELTASSPGINYIKNEKREAPVAESLLAQSSPVRISQSTHLTKTPGSAMNRAKYGASSYLLNSSPATAFQTVLNEAETDWHALCGLSPPRRSPRKNPHGTQSGLNPYATVTTSPISKMKTMDTLSALDLMKMTSSSPLTRSRVKSGHYQMDGSWFSSKGLCFGDKQAAASSSLTSPGSPSPSPAHLLKSRGVKRKTEAEVMLQPGQRTMQRSNSRTSAHNEAPQSSEKTRKAARQARQANIVGGAGNIDAGPFMGLDIAEGINGQEEEDEEEAGGGSPTLGRSKRMRNKSNQGSLSTHVSPQTSGEGLLNFAEDWTRSNSMKELFPSPIPVKQWDMNSPSNNLWQSPTSWAIASTLSSSNVKVEAEQDKRFCEQGDKVLLDLNINQEEKQLIRRKPLPATVEDAPSSINSASSSPMEEEDYLEEGEEMKGANLMDLFEDPYGLLAASGIGVQGIQPGLSMEDFDSIELFKGVDFNQQLDFFTQMGSNGIAAHLAPSQGESSTLMIEGKGKMTVPSNDMVATTTSSSSSNMTPAEFAALLKDPAMQAILTHMQLSSPSKAK